jgi:hypothetical protein
MDIIMKRLFTILACFFLLLGCVSSKSFEKLERRVTYLQDEKMMEEAAGVAGGMKIRGFYGLTSSDSGAGFNLAAKATIGGVASDYDLAIGRDVDGYVLMYYFLSTDSSTQSLPRIVWPTDRLPSTNGRWILITRFYSQEFYTDVDDGEHMFNVSNSDDPTYSGPTDWDMVVNRTKEWFGYYDITGGEWVKFRHGKVINAISASNDIPYSVHWGGLVTNLGQTTVPAVYNLRPAEKDMEITFYLLEAQPININPDDANKFIQTGDTYGLGVSMNSSPSGVGYTVKIRAVDNGSGGYDWATFPDNEAYWDVGT